MNRKNSPCHQCGVRTAECHATCELYKAFAEECEALRTKRNEIAVIYERRPVMERIIRKRIKDNSKKRRR